MTYRALLLILNFAALGLRLRVCTVPYRFWRLRLQVKKAALRINQPPMIGIVEIVIFLGWRASIPGL